MTGSKTKNSAKRQDALGPDSAATKSGRSAYPVGYCKPPAHSRWKPGQSGNRGGRRKNQPNIKTELKAIATKQVTVRDGETEHKVSMAAANILAHGVKGAKGDVRSAGLFLNVTQKMGLLEDDDGIILNERSDGEFAPATPSAASAPAQTQSELLFANVDLNLLTREDIVDLSRIADLIDSGGDFTALSAADFERVKQIVNKGRGTDGSPPVKPVVA